MKVYIICVWICLDIDGAGQSTLSMIKEDFKTAVYTLARDKYSLYSSYDLYRKIKQFYI